MARRKNLIRILKERNRMDVNVHTPVLLNIFAVLTLHILCRDFISQILISTDMAMATISETDMVVIILYTAIFRPDMVVILKAMLNRKPMVNLKLMVNPKHTANLKIINNLKLMVNQKHIVSLKVMALSLTVIRPMVKITMLRMKFNKLMKLHLPHTLSRHTTLNLMLLSKLISHPTINQQLMMLQHIPSKHMKLQLILLKRMKHKLIPISRMNLNNMSNPINIILKLVIQLMKLRILHKAMMGSKDMFIHTKNLLL